MLPINFAIKKRIGAAKAGAAISLLERLSAYHHGKNACRIHAYVSVMEKAHSEQALSASWARAKADWYDPVIAKEDDLLDRWEHEKNQENKGPRRKGYRW